MYNKIHVHDLTLTFILRSYLGQKPVKTANSLKISFSRILNARGEERLVSLSQRVPFSRTYISVTYIPIFDL
jgi:hypothetical protein